MDAPGDPAFNKVCARVGGSAGEDGEGLGQKRDLYAVRKS